MKNYEVQKNGFLWPMRQGSPMQWKIVQYDDETGISKLVADKIPVLKIANTMCQALKDSKEEFIIEEPPTPNFG